MMIHELQRRMDQDPSLNNVSILGVDPGTMRTGLQRHASWFIRVFIFQFLYPLLAWLKPPGPTRSTEQSASDIMGAAFDTNDVLGQFPKALYLDGTKLIEPSAESQDLRKMALVWNQTVKMTGLKREETLLANL
jgi:hypothetical protein